MRDCWLCKTAKAINTVDKLWQFCLTITLYRMYLLHGSVWRSLFQTIYCDSSLYLNTSELYKAYYVNYTVHGLSLSSHFYFPYLTFLLKLPSADVLQMSRTGSKMLASLRCCAFRRLPFPLSPLFAYPILSCFYRVQSSIKTLRLRPVCQTP